MHALRLAGLFALIAAAPAALAEHLDCESRPGDGPQACSTVNPGSDVRLVRQFGPARCVEGRNWSAQNDSIWVSDGCSAVFDVQAYDGAESAAADGEAPRNAYHRDDPEPPADRRDLADDRGADAAARSGDRADAPSRDDEVSDPDRSRDDDAGRDDDRADTYSRDDGGAGDLDDRRAHDGRRLAWAEGRASAREACVEEAANGQRFPPDRVFAGEPHRIRRGLYAVDLDTPIGTAECIVDRHGNVHAIER